MAKGKLEQVSNLDQLKIVEKNQSKKITDNKKTKYYHRLEQKNLSLDFSISIERERNLYKIELVSKHLRNSKTALNGIYAEKHLHKPQILFKNINNDGEFIFSFSSNTIGFKNNITPKKIMIKLDPGIYELYLISDFFYDTYQKLKLENINILLDKNFDTDGL